VDTKPGHIVTAPGVSVDAVQPGSADLPAGSVVTILGTGFDPLTKVRFDEVALADVRYVSATRIDVVLAAPARMHGMRIKVTNPDGSRSVYYSYQRARRQGVSDHPVLRDTVPVFPRPSVVSAQVDIAGSATGLALQNIGATAATVRVELVAADGTMLATTQLVVGASRFVVQELSEIFAVPYSAAQRVEVLATAPIQVMGIAVDATGAATPLPARKKP